MMIWFKSKVTDTKYGLDAKYRDHNRTKYISSKDNLMSLKVLCKDFPLHII